MVHQKSIFSAMILIGLVAGIGFSLVDQTRADSNTPAVVAKNAAVRSNPPRREIAKKMRGLVTSCDRDVLRNLDWFINDVLVANGYTHWVAAVNVRFRSHPEITGIMYNPELPIPDVKTFKNPTVLEPQELKAIADRVRSRGIDFVPLINHWGWNGLTLPYPELAENRVMPKAYCPRNPKTRAIMKDLCDEVIDLVHPHYFHAGMDEININLVPFDNLKWSDQIGICSRCNKDKPADIFAEEVNRLNTYFRGRGCQMMIWGDQLLNPPDYYTIYHQNNGVHGELTWPAVSKIDPSVMVCDWHYCPSKTYPSVDFLLRHKLNVIGSVAPYEANNIIQFTDYVRKIDNPKAMGMLMTFWGKMCKHSESREPSHYGFIDDPKVLEMITLAGRCFQEMK